MNPVLIKLKIMFKKIVLQNLKYTVLSVPSNGILESQNLGQSVFVIILTNSFSKM